MEDYRILPLIPLSALSLGVLCRFGSPFGLPNFDLNSLKCLVIGCSVQVGSEWRHGTEKMPKKKNKGGGGASAQGKKDSEAAAAAAAEIISAGGTIKVESSGFRS